MRLGRPADGFVDKNKILDITALGLFYLKSLTFLNLKK
jgi:hypothetical protein